MADLSLRVMIEMRLEEPFDATKIMRRAAALSAAGFAPDPSFASMAIDPMSTDRSRHGAAIVRGTIRAESLAAFEVLQTDQGLAG